MESYNWNQGNFISSQQYTNCFRQELGYCALDFSVPNDGTDPDYFNLCKDPNCPNAQVCNYFTVFTNVNFEQKNCYCSVQLAPANLSGSICKLPWPIKLRMQWWREAVVFVANFLMFKTYHHDRQWSEVIPSCFYLFLKKWAKSASLPADLHPFTLRVTAITGSNRIGLTGFKLNWAMVPCWSIWKPIFFTVL